MSLPWPKREPKQEIVPSPSSVPSIEFEDREENEDKPIPYHIAAGIIFFWIFVFVMMFFVLILAAVWGSFSNIAGFFFPSSKED
jgi:hypothetical protein